MELYPPTTGNEGERAREARPEGEFQCQKTNVLKLDKSIWKPF